MTERVIRFPINETHEGRVVDSQIQVYEGERLKLIHGIADRSLASDLDQNSPRVQRFLASVAERVGK